jgi:aspartate racemase
VLAYAARSLQAAGADFLVIATNTMHRVAPAIAAAVPLPILHIADPTAQAAIAQGCKAVGLLGTRFTMEQAFYKEHLQQHGLQVLVPDEEERAIVHQIIYEELCQGQVLTASRRVYQQIIQHLQAQGAEAIIAGCTEITLLIQAQDILLPLLDTTALHAAAAVDYSLAS